MTTTNKLQDAVHHIGDFADNFITHWIDDKDDKESQAAAKRAETETDAAKATLDNALRASRTLLVALRCLANRVNEVTAAGYGSGMFEPEMAEARSALRAATAAGITAK